ncbi:MAG: hypothetical protein IJC84_06265 [Clostridia bacterium]|nr:hypothetical protein [Clostridia bacterium]
MEKIYTIPVNEAFDEKEGCPFCRLRAMLEKNEVELILGASMMEPDIRIQTNEKGFCDRHFRRMFEAQKRLPLALMLESHLDVVRKECATPKLTLKDKLTSVAEKNAGFAEGCYVCDRVEFHLGKMFETACLLWDQDSAFRKKLEEQQYFCMPCYTRFLKTAKLFIPKKKQSDLLDAAQGVQMRYLDDLKSDVSHFCKKFDYRYQKEPWGNARDAVERSIRFLSGDEAIPVSAKAEGEE